MSNPLDPKRAAPDATASPETALPETTPRPAGDDAAGEIRLVRGARPIADYELIEVLGRGGFGEVWKARAPGDFQVALKFIRLGDQGGAIELRSLEFIKDQRHPHLLGNFGAWQRDGMLIVAMELADGTLLNRLRKAEREGSSGIPAMELLEYMREAAKGIDHLNGMGIQHRDIKPQNLLLVGGGVKVADFGLAKLLEHSMSSNSGAMTPAYAAPEFLNGQTSHRSDQYSLAVSYCQLRGGRMPFTGNPAQIMTGHLLHAPDLNMLPDEERPVVARSLSKQPDDRWPSCRAFVDALAMALGNTSGNLLVSPTPAAKGKSSIKAAPPAREPASHPTPVMSATRTAPEMAKGPDKGNSWRAPAAAPATGSKSGLGLFGVLLAIIALSLTAGGVFVVYQVCQPGTHDHSHGVAHSDPGDKKPPAVVPGPKGTPETVTPPLVAGPSLRVIAPENLTLEAGKRFPLKVKVVRNGCPGPIQLGPEVVPDGITVVGSRIPAGSDEGELDVFVAANAALDNAGVRISAAGDTARAEHALRVSVKRTAATAEIRILRAPARVEVDQQVTFTIEVMNRGDADLSNLRLIGKGPAGMVIVRGEGPATPTVDSPSFYFYPAGVLRPGQSMKFAITGRAMSDGEGVFHTEFFAKELGSTPVIQEDRVRIDRSLSPVKTAPVPPVPVKTAPVLQTRPAILRGTDEKGEILYYENREGVLAPTRLHPDVTAKVNGKSVLVNQVTGKQGIFAELIVDMTNSRLQEIRAYEPPNISPVTFYYKVLAPGQAKVLGLTTEQHKKLRDLFAEWRPEMSGSEVGAWVNKGRLVLTEQQRASLDPPSPDSGPPVRVPRPQAPRPEAPRRRLVTSDGRRVVSIEADGIHVRSNPGNQDLVKLAGGATAVDLALDAKGQRFYALFPGKIECYETATGKLIWRNTGFDGARELRISGDEVRFTTPDGPRIYNLATGAAPLVGD